MPELAVHVLKQNRVLRRVPLAPIPFKIGSQARCELVLEEPGVEPHHATVYLGIEGELEYRVRGASTVTPVVPGAHVECGGVTLAFLEGGASAAEAVGLGDHLLELVPVLWEEQGPARFFVGLLDLLRGELEASWAAVLELTGDEARVLHQAGSRPGGEGEPVSETVLTRLRAGEGPVLASDVLGDPELAVARSISDSVRSVLAVPMGPGALYLEGAAGRARYRPEEVALVQKVAGFVHRHLSRAREHVRLTGIQQLSQRREADPDELVGSSPAMQTLRAEIARAAEAGVTTLIQGESGTGKELVARALHRGSARRGGPFVPVHCMAFPESLIEDELFGHVEGAFSGAVGDRLGRFELADGGTLFLDELGELSPAVQVKLLRVLEERVVHRIGDETGRPVDIRLVAATHADLRGRVDGGTFREDLFFRISVFRLRVPPLRERGEDVIELAKHFLARFQGRMGRRLEGFTDEARAALRAHAWPGNVRELRNVIEQAFVREAGERIGVEALALGPSRAAAAPVGEVPDDLGDALALWEAAHLRRILEAVSGDVEQAAARLGISRTNLYKRCQDHGIRPKDFRPRG